METILRPAKTDCFGDANFPSPDFKDKDILKITQALAISKTLGHDDILTCMLKSDSCCS